MPDIIAADALKLLIDNMTTPLHTISLFNKSLEIAYHNGIKPIDLKSVENRFKIIFLKVRKLQTFERLLFVSSVVSAIASDSYHGAASD